MIDASNGISLFRRWLVILGLVLGFLVYDEKSGLVFWLAVFGGLVMVWSIVGAILLGVLRADVTRLRMIFLASIVVFLTFAMVHHLSTH